MKNTLSYIFAFSTNLIVFIVANEYFKQQRINIDVIGFCLQFAISLIGTFLIAFVVFYDSKTLLTQEDKVPQITFLTISGFLGWLFEFVFFELPKIISTI